uniref:Protein-glutamine gamma-glutamyltransferase 2 n=1 Tax=Esox lucius TaxID=8010 RepID=A0A3P9A583_ESOLU
MNLFFLPFEDVVKVDLNCEKNNRAHNTIDISASRLIVRRGQSFLVRLELRGPFRPTTDVLELTVETGPKPSERLGTRSVFRLSASLGNDSSWMAEVHRDSNLPAGSVTLGITSPANAPVGEYRLSLSVKTSTTAVTGRSLCKLILLFNPWCQEDWVYLPKQEERQEYVMTEHGLVFIGGSRSISSMAWDFGQFEPDIVDICLKMLDMNPKCLRNPPEDFSARCNPIYVSRVVSAMVNTNDDKGVVAGRWSEPYAGGERPTSWHGSVDILRRWYQSNCNPVKYGQCWVFASVMCTVLRCLGIPCRVITNFGSAHDTDKNLTIDKYYSDYGICPESNDSVWNFHVWVEAWMKRPDLSRDSLYDGWQVVDATPQETSNGVFCCGPAPVKAILEGHTDLKYDVDFVFAEVNADQVEWKVFPDGSKTRINTDTSSVGQNISTKAIGIDRRQDITANYKYAEGTEMERIVYNQAVRRGTKPRYSDDTVDNHLQNRLDVSPSIVLLNKPVYGQDIDLKLTLKNDDRVTRTLLIRVNAQAVRINGTISSQIQSQLIEQMILPNQGMLTRFSIALFQLKQCFAIKLLWLRQHLYQYKKCSEDHTAAIPFMLKSLIPMLKPRQRIRLTWAFTPSRPGLKKLVATFDCGQFRNIKASCNVEVRPAPGA